MFSAGRAVLRSLISPPIAAVVTLALLAALMALTRTPDQSMASPQPDTLYGVNSHSDALSVIDPASGSVTLIGPLDPDPAVFVTPIAMAVHPDGRLFVWNNSNQGETTGVLLTVDTCTGLATDVDPSTPPLGLGGFGGLAFAPDGTLFDTGVDVVDTTTGARTFVGSPGLRIGGADFDSSGTFYGVELSLGSERLVTINTSTGAATVVGTLSVDVGTVGSIVFDPTDTLIGSATNGPLGNILFDIDPANGTVSNIRTILGTAAPQGMGFAPGCPDDDGDGILDVVDGCPDDPEDLDGFEDADGCPDPDNDGDGILDVVDGCPDDPEDLDGFEDADGCPDPDNDGDGILDVVDGCPDEAGSATAGGCPDADGDGVPDALDACPNEAESGADGCVPVGGIVELAVGSGDSPVEHESGRGPLRELAALAVALATIAGVSWHRYRQGVG